MEKPSDRIVLALDVDRIEQALLYVLEIGNSVGLFKIGLQTLTNAGPGVFGQILKKHSHAKFFYDAKFHDIPRSVEAASKISAQVPGIEFISVHASAGREAMRAAAKACEGAKPIAITVLTSLSDEDCRETYGADRRTVVRRFASWAAESGFAGIVCSPLELELLRDVRLETPDGRRLLKMVPGIRPEWARSNDQKTTATPFEAMRDGADYLIIGRPITNPPPAIGSPLAAVHAIAQDIERGLDARKS